MSIDRGESPELTPESFLTFSMLLTISNPLSSPIISSVWVSSGKSSSTTVKEPTATPGEFSSTVSFDNIMSVGGFSVSYSSSKHGPSMQRKFVFPFSSSPSHERAVM